MIRFMTDLDHVYPLQLHKVMSVISIFVSTWVNISFRNIILQNWLCNPMGKVDGWKGWDWLQEQNNLYTRASKLIFTHKYY